MHRFKSCPRRVRDSRWWGSLTIVPARKKAEHLSLVTKTKTIHKKQFIIIIKNITKTIPPPPHHHHHRISEESFEILKYWNPDCYEMLKRETVILFTSFPQMDDLVLTLTHPCWLLQPFRLFWKCPSGFYSLDIIKVRWKNVLTQLKNKTIMKCFCLQSLFLIFYTLYFAAYIFVLSVL